MRGVGNATGTVQGTVCGPEIGTGGDGRSGTTAAVTSAGSEGNSTGEAAVRPGADGAIGVSGTATGTGAKGETLGGTCCNSSDCGRGTNGCTVGTGIGGGFEVTTGIGTGGDKWLPIELVTDSKAGMGEGWEETSATSLAAEAKGLLSWPPVFGSWSTRGFDTVGTMGTPGD